MPIHNQLQNLQNLHRYFAYAVIDLHKFCPLISRYYIDLLQCQMKAINYDFTTGQFLNSPNSRFAVSCEHLL